MAFVTPVVDHWLEREIAQWVHPMKDRSDDPSHHERTLLPRSYISLLINKKEGRNVLFNDTLNTFYLQLYGNVLFNDALNTFYLWLYGNVLFNNTLNTFYLQLYGVRHGKGSFRYRATWVTLSD